MGKNQDSNSFDWLSKGNLSDYLKDEVSGIKNLVYFPVRHSKLNEAILLLKNRKFLLLSEDKFKDFSYSEYRKIRKEKPYLIRCISGGNNKDEIEIKLYSERKIVVSCVERDGKDFKKVPKIVFLANPPDDLFIRLGVLSRKGRRVLSEIKVSLQQLLHRLLHL